MKKLVRFALLSLAFVLSGTAFGQSNLPACQGSDTAKWNNCFGSWTASNGNNYVGEWKNGTFNGQGTFTWAGGEKYVGEWKDGTFNGQGTYTYVSGDKYVGEFKDNKYNGQGTFTNANGSKYVGEYKDDLKNGQGITYSANGSIKESGIYKDDKLVTSQYIDPNSFKRIAINNSAPVVSDSQRQAIEQRERQVELEARRVAEERLQLDAEKVQNKDFARKRCVDVGFPAGTAGHADCVKQYLKSAGRGKGKDKRAPPGNIKLDEENATEQQKKNEVPNSAVDKLNNPDSVTWVDSLDENAWVLQHGAFDSLAEARTFQSSALGYKSGKVLFTQRKGSMAYYMLITGPYEKNAAEDLMKQHPPLSKAWLRSVKSLKAQLAE